MKKEVEHHPALKKKLTFGQIAADKLTSWAGSWTFIIIIILLIIAWVTLNITAFIGRWDPWPFIMLNLVLSCLAALQAPIILMSQNREAQKDRLRALYDYQTDKKALKEIEKIRDQLTNIEKKIK